MGQYPIHTSTTVAMFKTRVGRSIIDYILFLKGMAIKKSSDLINISGSIAEKAPNTFTQLEVNLDLDPLSREVFVVTDVALDPYSPDPQPGTVSEVFISVCATSQTQVQNLSEPRCMSNVIDRIYGGAAEFNFARVAMPTVIDTTGSSKDYLGVISTPDFFVQVRGNANINPKGGVFRITGYRARADADTYAALVASEVLSV